MSKRDKITANLGVIEQLLCKVPGERCIKLHYAWNLKAPHAWEIKPRRINDYHLLFVRDGHGRYTLDGQEVELRRGRIVFVGGGASYAGEQDISKPLFIIPLRFGFYGNADGQQPVSPTASLYYSYTSKNVAELEFLFLEIWRLHNALDNSLSESNISSLLHALLCRTWFEASEDAGSGRDDRLEEVGNWLKAHPLDRSNIGVLAQKAGISRKYFSILFKRYYGVAPKAFQVRQRIHYGKYLLRESACPIKEIALQLGYADQYVFSKQFKSIAGYAPSEIRSATGKK